MVDRMPGMPRLLVAWEEDPGFLDSTVAGHAPFYVLEDNEELINNRYC